MRSWIALLRGINVGGKNKLPMKALAGELEAISLLDIRTYIQSGNVVFRCPDERIITLAEETSASINATFGFTPHVAVMSAEELAASVAANPSPESVAEMDGRTVHLFFLAKPPAIIDEERLEAARRATERWRIKGAVFYLHTPEGFGHSKLAVHAEKILGVPATARNWRTVCALLDLAGHHSS